MSDFEDQAKEDLQVMIDEMGSEWTISGTTYDGVEGDGTLGNDLQLEGFREDVATSVNIIKDDFDGTLPSVGDQITKVENSKVYRISQVVTSEGDPGVRFDLISIEK